MTASDLKGQRHIVILQSDSDMSMIEFTGEDAMEKAHAAAQDVAVRDFPGCITVAVRIRQIYRPQYSHLSR